MNKIDAPGSLLLEEKTLCTELWFGDNQICCLPWQGMTLCVECFLSCLKLLLDLAGVASSRYLPFSIPEFGGVWRPGHIPIVCFLKHFSSQCHEQEGFDWSTLSCHLHNQLNSSLSNIFLLFWGLMTMVKVFNFSSYTDFLDNWFCLCITSFHMWGNLVSVLEIS
jgi:hypothetical protein